MPRIVVAVAVFALIAFSIGFNTARYSVVWEMVGGPPQFPQSPQPAAPASLSEPAAAEQSATAAGSATSWDSTSAEPAPYGWESGTSYQDSSDAYDSGDVAAGDVAAADVEEEQTEYKDSYSYAQQTEDEEPSEEYASGVDPAAVDVAGYDDSADAIRRLPPLDQVAPLSVDRYAPHWPAESAAGYPSSGT